MSNHTSSTMRILTLAAILPLLLLLDAGCAGPQHGDTGNAPVDPHEQLAAFMADLQLWQEAGRYALETGVIPEPRNAREAAYRAWAAAQGSATGKSIVEGWEDVESILGSVVRRTALAESAFLTACVDHGYDRIMVEAWIAVNNEDLLRDRIVQALADPRWASIRRGASP